MSEIDTDGEQRLKIEVLQYPLNGKGRPVASVKAGGRFIAYLSMPYQKRYFYRGRMVTIAGVVSGVEEYSLANDEKQQLPIVDSTDYYTWRRARSEHWHHDEYHRHYRYRPYFYYHYGVSYSGKRSKFVFTLPHKKIKRKLLHR